jgi:hypothetical protein
MQSAIPVHSIHGMTSCVVQKKYEIREVEASRASRGCGWGGHGLNGSGNNFFARILQKPWFQQIHLEHESPAPIQSEPDQLSTLCMEFLLFQPIRLCPLHNLVNEDIDLAGGWPDGSNERLLEPIVCMNTEKHFQPLKLYRRPVKFSNSVNNPCCCEFEDLHVPSSSFKFGRREFCNMGRQVRRVLEVIKELHLESLCHLHGFRSTLKECFTFLLTTSTGVDLTDI